MSTSNQDELDEANETFRLQLSNPVAATIADSSGTATILDNDPTPSISVSDAGTRPEGGYASRFDITLSAPSGRTVSVNYTTVDGTATAPGDYSARSGTMTFAAGQTTKAVLVPSNQDALDEANETFRLQLSSPVATTIADASGTATIRDDDP